MLVLALLSFSLVMADPLLWGPYRSNLYFGMRPKIPHSLMTGLMWFSNANFGGLQNLRHDCLQHEDTTYSWTQYDTRLGGTQRIFDRAHNLNLTIDLAKSDDGDAWVARIKGEQAKDGISTLVWYSGLEGEGHLDLASSLTPQGISSPHFKGRSPELGNFNLKITDEGNTVPESDHVIAEDFDANFWKYTTLNVPADNVWKAKDIYLTFLQDNVNLIGSKLNPDEEDLATMPSWVAMSLNNKNDLKGYMHYTQKTFQGPFEFTVTYNDLKPDFKARDKALQKKFSHIKGDAKHKQFAQELISNLAAGIGYFYGDSLVADSLDLSEYETAPPEQLYTCTPSRGFFPRGFYWDEGFHLLGLIDQDLDQVLEILESWFKLMDESGWIGREQILGAEARARVPQEFQVQSTSIANPPTIVTFLAHLGTINDKSVQKKLRDIFPLLEVHFKWFRTSQRGKILDYDREAHSNVEAYRWRGRTETHVLASGLDDYPRSRFMSEGELNVDLLSWVGAMADALSRIASTIGDEKKEAQYKKITQDVKQNLLDLHWSAENSAFCDVAVDDFDEDIHECHIGYVSHLPFFLRLIDADDDERLLAVLRDLRDEEKLWSKAGIRSLSKSDEFFGTGENYWRGSIWINMNYLALDALKYYHKHGSAKIAATCAKIYSELRQNVIDNTFEQWVKTGNAYEQYEALTGNGKGVQQFVGWTSLVANMMAMPAELDGHDEL